MPGRCSHQRDVGLLRLRHMPFIGAKHHIQTLELRHTYVHTELCRVARYSHSLHYNYVSVPHGECTTFLQCMCVCAPGSVIWVCIESAVALHQIQLSLVLDGRFTLTSFQAVSSA